MDMMLPGRLYPKLINLKVDIVSVLRNLVFSNGLLDILESPQHLIELRHGMPDLR